MELESLQNGMSYNFFLIAIICLCRVASGIIIMIIGGVGRYLDLHAGRSKYWLSLLAHDKDKTRFPMLFQLQVSIKLLDEYEIDFFHNINLQS